MTARFDRAWAKASRANMAASVGFLLAQSPSRSASAAPATPEQRRARPPDAYASTPTRLRNIANGLRPQKASLVEGV